MMIYITFLVITNVIVIMLLHHSVMQSLHVGMRIRIACSSLLYRKVIILDCKDIRPLIAIIGTIMWQKVDISSFVGIGTLLIIVLPGQGTLSFLNFKLRTMIAPLIDRRVQLMSELITGIQMKMYAWEKLFSQIISIIRKLEIKQIKFSRAAYLVIIVFTDIIILFSNLCLIFTGFFAHEVNTRRFSENTPQLQFKSQKPKEESNAENQIDRYISRNGSIVLSEHQRLSDLPVYVKLQRVSANWISGQLPPTLCNINLIIKPGQLCAVVGAVGSGKLSILHLLLKEMNPGTGSIILTQGSSKYDFPGNLFTEYFTNNPNLRISYASQELLLFSGTVRDNILFGYVYIFLHVSIKNLLCVIYVPGQGLKIIIETTICIFFGFIIQNILLWLQYTCYSDSIVIQMHVLAQFAELPLHSDTDDSDYVENISEAEMMAHGRVVGRVYKEYLYNGDNNFTLFVLLMIFIISQVATTGNDHWLSYWTTLEDVRRIENTSDVKQFANMYNDSFLESIFTLNPDGLLSTMDAIYV
ncbi:MRP4 protein, partial [Acromyrmex heyeri]